MIEIAADYARYRLFFSRRPGNKSILIVSSNFLAANVFLFTSKNDYHRKRRRALGALFFIRE